MLQPALPSAIFLPGELLRVLIVLPVGSAKSKTWPEIMSQIDLTGMPLSIDAVRTPGDG